MKMLLFTVGIFFSLTCQADGNSSSIEIQIKNDILNGYDKLARPVKNSSDVTTVVLDPGLYSLIGINAAEQEIIFKQWFRMYWTDQFLTWNPDAYGGVNHIKMSRSEVWLPDIRILSMTDKYQLHDDEYFVKVKSDGSIQSSIDQLVTLYCLFDVSSFPYDSQNCEVTYSSWSFNANEINLNVAQPTDLQMYMENNEWTLRNYTAKVTTYTAAFGIFVYATYNIKITRKPSYYVNTFMWPAFIITCLSVVGAFSPFNEVGEREEKVTLGLTTLLTMAVILTIVTDQMPKSSNGMPLLGVFIFVEIAVTVIATLFATALIHLHYGWVKNQRVPRFLMTIMCLTNETQEKVVKSAIKQRNNSIRTASNIRLPVGDNISEYDKENLRQEWGIVTKRLDFCCLITFLILNSAIFAITVFIGNAKLDD